MGGGVNGAIGAGASAVAAPLLDEMQAKMTQSLIDSGMNSETARATASLIAVGTAATAGGLAGGGIQSATTAATIDLNNRQLHPDETQRIKDLAKGDVKKEARLTAAACSMVRCYAEYPEGSTAYNQLKSLADAGASDDFASERQLLQNQMGLFTYTTTSLFSDQNADSMKQLNNTYQIGTRVLGVGQAALGTLAIGGGIVTAPVSCATGVGCWANAIVIGGGVDALYTGSKQAVSGQSEATLANQALQSLGLSPGAATYAEIVLGVSAATKVGQVLNSATNQLAKSNNLSAASYQDFVPQGVKATPEVMASPQVQAMMTEIKSANPSISIIDLERRAAEWIESGANLPATATAAPGSMLIKIVPKGEGVTPHSPYWFTPAQARAIGTMTPEQAGQVLGLPASQAAKILNGGADFFAITPKVGATPKVFVSDIAPTSQGSYFTAPTAQQVIVPNRSLWNPPELVNPLTLRKGN